MTSIQLTLGARGMGLMLAIGLGFDPVACAAQTPFADSLPVTSGFGLQRGKAYRSPSGKHHLTFAKDGNLVVTRVSDNGFVWGVDKLAANYGRSDRAEMRADGTFVLLDSNGGMIWSPPLKRKVPGSVLTVSDTGALQVRTPLTAFAGDEIVWASDGNILSSLSFAAALPLTAGFTLQPMKAYRSPWGFHDLTFGNDGNLAVRQSRGNIFVWGLKNQVPNLPRTVRPEMRADGSFVMVEASGGIAWAAPQKRKEPGSTLTVSFGGALQVVTPGGEIVWASDGVLEAPVDVSQPSNAASCVPKDEGTSGWDKCIKMAQPQITILGSKRATLKAMNAVANVYAGMTGRFRPNYPLNTLDGFKVYLTNGEVGAELKGLSTVGAMWEGGTGEKSRDFLQGGASRDYLWITEEMICHEGVPARNNNMASLGLAQRDDVLRTFDQVVHEMGHSLHYRYGIADTSENWAWTIQAWFAAPKDVTNTMERTASTLLTSKASFSCEKYVAATAPRMPAAASPVSRTQPPQPQSRAGQDVELRQSRQGSLQGAFVANGYALQWQADGNVCLNKGSETYAGWCLSEESPSFANARKVLFRQGTLTVLDGAGQRIWQSTPANDPAAKLDITPQGRLQITDGAGKILWSKGGNQPPPASTTPSPLIPEPGKQYVEVQPDNMTFKYYKFVEERTTNGKVFWNFSHCPTPSPGGFLYSNSRANVKLMRVEDALAKGLKPVNEPCDVNTAPLGK